jgi:hypothetical protein
VFVELAKNCVKLRLNPLSRTIKYAGIIGISARNKTNKKVKGRPDMLISPLAEALALSPAFLICLLSQQTCLREKLLLT